MKKLQVILQTTNCYLGREKYTLNTNPPTHLLQAFLYIIHCAAAAATNPHTICLGWFTSISNWLLSNQGACWARWGNFFSFWLIWKFKSSCTWILWLLSAGESMLKICWHSLDLLSFSLVLWKYSFLGGPRVHKVALKMCLNSHSWRSLSVLDWRRFCSAQLLCWHRRHHPLA